MTLEEKIEQTITTEERRMLVTQGKIDALRAVLIELTKPEEEEGEGAEVEADA